MAADEVEGHKGHTALPALFRVQLADNARRKGARVGVFIIQRLIECVEGLPADDAFAAHLKRFRAGDGQGNIPHDPDGMGDVLALQPIAAGNGLYELTLLIAQY